MWVEAYTKPLEGENDKSIEHLVQKYFRTIAFRDIKFLTDYVIQRTVYVGPSYEGGLLYRLLKYVGREGLSVAGRVKFWRRYSTVAKLTLDRQKANKTLIIKKYMMKGKMGCMMIV